MGWGCDRIDGVGSCCYVVLCGVAWCCIVLRVVCELALAGIGPHVMKQNRYGRYE